MDKADVVGYLHPSKQEIIDAFGMPKGILLDVPDGYYWATGSDMSCTAEDFVWELEDSGLYRSCLIGWYGTEYRYYGVWERHDDKG